MPRKFLPYLDGALPPTYRQIDAPATSADRVWEVVHRDGRISVRVEAEPVAVVPDEAPQLAIRTLLSDLELWVAEHARHYVFVHAGCVVVDGKAIVIPGRSMAGKTSLTAALVRAGATYYSDEYAVFDRHGLVRPYPRRLQIRPPGGGESTPTPVSSLGGTAGRGPRPVGLVAALRYDAADGWAVEPMSPGHAVLALLDNTVPARSRPRAALTAFSAVSAGSPVMLRGSRGDADAAAARLIECLSPAPSRRSSAVLVSE